MLNNENMSKNFKEITKNLSTYLGKMRAEIPAVMQGFSSVMQAATKEGALDKKTKELMALALSIASRCDGCIGFHTQTLVQLGVTQGRIPRDIRDGHLYGRGTFVDLCRRGSERL